MNSKIIKVCGLTDKKEAEYLNRYGVDFAGFVLFYPKSKRNVDIALATEIMQGLDARIKKVAVVVEPTIDQAVQIEGAGFDYIQIHGEVDDRIYSELTIPVLKAFNGTEVERYEQYLANDRIAGFVFDAADPGSGKAFDWEALSKLPKTDKMTLLAGGLTPDNVMQALNVLTEMNGVDVSSGVEIAKDIRGKSEDKIKAFVEAVRNVAGGTVTK